MSVRPGPRASWAEAISGLGIVSPRENVAVLVGDGSQRIFERIEAARARFAELGFDRVTLSIADPRLDFRSTSRVYRDFAYVLDVPDGFPDMTEAEQLAVLERIIPKPRPPSAKMPRRMGRSVPD